ncbi:MAG TPA: hypothetical protein VGE07_09815 [Herpetosiphonaceae bacterium]
MRLSKTASRILLAAIACALLLASGGRSAAVGRPSQLLLKDIFPGSHESYVHQLASLGDVAFFTRLVNSGSELWITDGTADGTRLVRDLPRVDSGIIISIAALGDRVVILRDTAAGFDLWQSDGTSEGTTQIANVAGQQPDGKIVVSAGYAYVATSTGDGADTVHRLWRTDGTAANTQSLGQMTNTRLVARLEPVAAGGQIYAWFMENAGYGAYKKTLKYFNGTALVDVYTCSHDPAPDYCGYYGTWERGIVVGLQGPTRLRFIDGTTASDLDLSAFGLTRPYEMKGLGQRVLFLATGPDGNLELWSTDGTAAGTRGVRSFGPQASVSAFDLTVAHGVMYFITSAGSRWSYTMKLWRSDGTEAGTRSILDVGPSTVTMPGLDNLQTVGSRLVFPARDSAHGAELWQIAGPDAPPTLILDLNPGPWDSVSIDYYSLQVVPLRGGLLWTASDAEVGKEPRYLAPSFTPRLEPAWAGGPSGGLATAPVILGNRGAASPPVTLTLNLPAGVSLVDHTLSVSPTIAGDTATWALPALPTGEQTARFTFRLPEAPLGTALTATLSLAPGDLSVPIRLHVAHQYYLPAVSHLRFERETAP